MEMESLSTVIFTIPQNPWIRFFPAFRLKYKHRNQGKKVVWMPVNITREFVQQLMEQNTTLLKQNAVLANQVDELTSTVRELNQTIQELKEQLNKNSQNSSKPPSSDGFKKPAPKSLRKPSGKKAGGQHGHVGTHLAVVAEPDDIIKHMPSACEGCPHFERCKETAWIAEKRHVVDAVVDVKITEHQSLEIPVCMRHGDPRRGEFPSAVKATVQYGENLQALSTA